MHIKKIIVVFLGIAAILLFVSKDRFKKNPNTNELSTQNTSPNTTQEKTQNTETHTTPEASLSPSTSPGSLKRYINNEYGFDLMIPKESIITQVNNTNIRIQNYQTDQTFYDLKPEEFFINILLYPHDENKKMNQSCNKILENIEFSSLTGLDENFTVYFGTVPFQGGEGVTSHGLCIDKYTLPTGTGLDIYIGGTDGSIDKKLIQSILRSFQFNYGSL
jgi:hypothetical protein